MATTTPQRSRSTTGRSARAAALAVVAVALAATAGCGGGYYEEGYYEEPVPLYGTVEVDNRTNSTTFEDVFGFYLSPAGTGAWTGNLLTGPLPPGFAEVVGDFVEDFYDAEADVGEFGDVATWFDEFVLGGDLTTFEVF